MKRFLIHIVSIAALFIGILIILDLTYTTIFCRTKNKTKLNWVLNMHNQTVDYIIVGSSRVLFHIDADMINDSTNQVGYNLGEPDFGLNETLLLLKIFYEQGNQVRNVFIQLDNNWNESEPNELGAASFMPFLYKTTIRKHYNQWGTKYRLYSSIPFIRYMYYAKSIGFRQLINSVFNDRARSSTYGYDYLSGQINIKEIEKESFIPMADNSQIQEMKKLTMANKSQAIFFTAPILKFNPLDFDLLAKIIDHYTNFANNVSDSKLFFDSIHLNEEGAEIFTRNFMHCYFKNTNLTYQTDKNRTNGLEGQAL